MRAAIKISNLSKRFSLEHPDSGHQSLQRQVLSWFKKNEPTEAPKIFEALSDINLTIQEGEVLGIIGANGAGKSTLLKILSQVLSPSSGEIEIFGRLGAILEVGMGFHADLSGRENIHMSAVLLGMTAEEVSHTTNDIIDFADIGSFIDVPVKHYSSGMYMRLAFAVCAHLKHEILILDEVLAVGDAAFQKKCLGLMQEEAQSGRTVLFVSHNMTAVNALCTRCIYLKEGKIIADGNPSDVIKCYMEAEATNQSEVEWSESDAPGNELYRLRSVKMLDDSGEPIRSAKNSDAFNIEIRYDVLKDNTPVGATIAFFDHNLQCLFGTLSNQDSKWHGVPRNKGHYVSNIKIPKDLFNQGVFYVGVLLWTSNYANVVRVDEAIEIEIQDTGEIRGDYFGHMEGAFLPRIPWETKKLEA